MIESGLISIRTVLAKVAPKIDHKKYYCPEQDSHIRDKVKVVLELPIYVTKKELNNAAGIDTCNLAGKSDFFALKAEVDKLDFKACVCYFHQIFIFSPNDSLSKTMKSGFYFILALFVLEILTFCVSVLPYFLPVGHCFRG